VLEQQREQRELLRRQQELRERKAIPDDAVEDQVDTKADKKPPLAGVSFMLNKVETDASAVLSESEIRAIASRYEGRRVTIADLFTMIAEFNSAYSNTKIIGAKAVLPPQKIKDGVVKVRLIEGRVGQVRIGELDSTRPEYISDRLALQAGELVYLDDLEQRLFHFNALNDIEIRTVLEPGQTFGTTDYEVRVKEPPRYAYNFFIDNAGTDDIGEYRAGFNFTDRSLTGRRDLLALGGYVGEGSRGTYLSYTVPVGVHGTKFGLNADYSEIDIIDGPLEPLDVTGDSWGLGLSLTHPLHVGRDYLSQGFVGFNAGSSSTDFDDVRLFNVDVRTFTVGFDASAFSHNGSWYTRHAFTYGPNGMGNDVDFIKYNGEGSWLHILDNRWVLTLRGKLQLADEDLLPASEQFQVGGMSSVRGYPEGLLIGDKGYLISAELSFPWPGEKRLDNPLADRLRGLLFFDHGAAFPYKGNGEGTDSDDFLASFGVGVQINLGANLRGRIVLAQPLIHRADGEDDPRLHFYLESTPF